jgi:predicted RNA-binding protein with PIN domain
MQRQYLIDGYNLIYQFPELRKLLERDLESARERLISRLSSFAIEENVEVMVIFDGDTRIPENSIKRQGVKVVFSKMPEKADPVIKRLIDSKSDSDDMVLVSSDLEIVNYAKLNSVSVVSSRSFANDLTVNSTRDKEKKYEHTMSPEELEEWMRLFKKGEDNQEE